VVVVYAGTNDINRKLPPAMVHADFVRLVEMIHAALPDTEIVYLSSTPNRSRWHWQEQMQAYDTLNKAFAAKHKFITFIDMVDLFLGEDGLPNPAFFIDDQLHFNSTGYAVWNRTLAPVLREK
jgi:lysophospholipase L1-like esterase